MRAAEFRKKNKVCAIAAAAALKENSCVPVTPQINIEEDVITHLFIVMEKLKTAVLKTRT